MAKASVLILASPNMGPWNEDTQQDDCLDTLNVFFVDTISCKYIV